jgi:hypothetical protein
MSSPLVGTNCDLLTLHHVFAGGGGGGGGGGHQ